MSVMSQSREPGREPALSAGIRPARTTEDFPLPEGPNDGDEAVRGDPVQQLVDEGGAAVEVDGVVLGEGAQALVRVARLLRDRLDDLGRPHDVDTCRPAELPQEPVDLGEPVQRVSGHRLAHDCCDRLGDVLAGVPQVGGGVGVRGRHAAQDLEGQRTEGEDVAPDGALLAGHLLGDRQTARDRLEAAVAVGRHHEVGQVGVAHLVEEAQRRFQVPATRAERIGQAAAAHQRHDEVRAGRIPPVVVQRQHVGTP